MFDPNARFVLDKITKYDHGITELQIRQLDSNGTAMLGSLVQLFAAYEEWSVGTLRGSVLYETIAMDDASVYAEPCPDQPGLYDSILEIDLACALAASDAGGSGGGAAAGASGAGAAATAPATATTTAPTSVQRCPKCKAKVQQCMCNVRRNSADMLRAPSQCIQSTSQGACQKLSAAGKSPQCADHTCQQNKCLAAKSSKERFCKRHGKQKKQTPPPIAQQVTIQMNPAYAGPGGSGGVGGGGGGNEGAGFIPATYDAADAPRSSTIVYATPVEESDDGMYADADTTQSRV
jgi:hypothetical protein